MPDYLTQRNGHWQFVRRVPSEYSTLDQRGIIKHSTKVPVAGDRRGSKASRVADAMNRELEAYWRGLIEGKAQEAADRYAEARRRARAMGFDYVGTDELSTRITAELVERFEKLAGVVNDPGARAALLGYERQPSVKLSEVFPKFEHQTRTEVSDMSEDQLRRWKNGYKLAAADFMGVIGDKELTAITHGDVLDYVEWLEDRVADGEILAKTANKYIGRNSNMIREINRKLRLGLPDLFSGMRLKGGKTNTRPPFPAAFVQNSILAEGALAGLNDEARRAVYVIAETGLRLSEAVNLNETTIHLDCDVPYVEVLPDGRRVKTKDSIRQIPLVGVALTALRLHPGGFPRYLDKGASFSAYVNGYMQEKGLRPTPKHTVYSLRHTFKDRLIAAKCADSMIEALMGHADDHPKYGEGPPLAMKRDVLQAIAFKAPAVL
jgi:integrase